jgi:hypothetical protein
MTSLIDIMVTYILAGPSLSMDTLSDTAVHYRTELTAQSTEYTDTHANKTFRAFSRAFSRDGPGGAFLETHRSAAVHRPRGGEFGKWDWPGKPSEPLMWRLGPRLLVDPPTVGVACCASYSRQEKREKRIP